MFNRLLQLFRASAKETPAQSYKKPLDRERARLLKHGLTPELVTTALCLREILPDGLGYDGGIFDSPFASFDVVGYSATPTFGGYPHATVTSGVNDNGASEARAVREYARLRKNGYSDEEIEIIRMGREMWGSIMEYAAHANRQVNIEAVTETIANRVLEAVQVHNLGATGKPTPPVFHAQNVAPRRAFGD